MFDCYMLVQVQGKSIVGVLSVREKRIAEDREAVFEWIEQHKRKPSEHQCGEEKSISRRWRRMQSSFKSLPDDVKERIEEIVLCSEAKKCMWQPEFETEAVYCACMPA